MNPIQNKETFFEKITNKFRKKKSINIITSNPYDIHITRLQVDNQRLADAIKKAGMSAVEASQALQTNLAEIGKLWISGKSEK